MIGKVMRGRATKVMVAAALVGTVLVVGTSSPIGAAPQVKTLQASCAGRDPDDGPLLAALGGAPVLPIEVTSDVPATLEPEQNGSPIAFTIGLNLPQSLVNQAAPLVTGGIVNVKGLEIDVTAGGPGLESPIVVSAPPTDRQLVLAVGQPAGSTIGPLTGTLDGVKKGGIIKYSITKISFAIAVNAAGRDLVVDLVCGAPGTAAVTQIPIPGAPVIQQPIAVNANANQKVLVDVLGNFTTKGTTEDGRTLDIDPNSLKVLEGPGVIENGQVAITAGQSTSVLVEVCATETLEGVEEIQRLTIDRTPDALKKGVAFTLDYDGKVSPAIDLVGPGLFGPSAFDPRDADAADPQRWKNNANKYITSVHQLPTAAEVQAALEATPGIGAGGVKVFSTNQNPGDETLAVGDRLPSGQYDVVFTAQKDVPQLSSPNWWSIFPQEVLSDLLSLAGSIGGGDGEGGEEEPSPVPEGLTARQYLDQLVAAGDYATALEILPLALVETILENIDAILAFINSLFTAKPAITTLVNGEEPLGICTQAVVDVTVASVAGTGTTPTDVSGVSATNSGASLAFAG